MNNQERISLPSHECMFCRKTIEKAGGRRIFSKHDLSITRSKKYRGGGNKDCPFVSVPFGKKQYINFRGKKELWTRVLETYVTREFNAGRQPWYCQKCVGRICRECGSPVQYLHGCDVIYEDGSTTHSAIFPIPQGCINRRCKAHRKASN